MMRQLSDLNIHFYQYCIVKALLYSAASSCLYAGFGNTLLMPFIAAVSLGLDCLVIGLLTRSFYSLDPSGGRLGQLLLLISCVILFFYPIAWDDLSYGLVLPREYLAQNSFKPINEYGVFTYFPFVEYGRTALSFAFGNELQMFLYRTEGLAFYLITFVALLQISNSSYGEGKKCEFTYFLTLLLMTTVTAFSVYAFVKPESFTTTCFAIAVLMFVERRASKAIIISLISIPLKYTAVISGLPIIILSVSKIRHEFQKIGPLEVAGCLAMLVITGLWLFNNYSYTSSPFYPLLMSVFPYSGDGVMDANEYKHVIATLLNQQDVSPTTIVSLKYFKYIATQLGGALLFLPLFPLLLWRKTRKYISQRLILLSVACTVALSIFLLILFSEFRYAYILVCIVVMTITLSINGFLKDSSNRLFLKIIICLVCLQLIFVMARNFKNSIFDPSLSLLPVNLSSEQREEINCIRSIPNRNIRTATFEQSFYFWKSPFFFIHELNEYIGINPSKKNIEYAFEKFQVNFILLRNEYKDPSFLNSLKIGGLPREMPQAFLGKLNEMYDFRVVKIEACSNIHVYELFRKNK
jgi:hypothetical protein